MNLKEQLLNIGLTDETAQKVIIVVGESYIPKLQFDEISEENKTLKQSITDRDKQLEDLKKVSGDNEELKKQIETLQKLNAEQKKTHEAEINQMRLDNAIDTALTAAGAKNNKAVKSLLNMDKVKLGEDGKLSGLDDQLEALQKSDGYMFAENQPPTFRGFQPGASSDMNPSTDIDVSEMTYSQLNAYMAANPGVKL